MTASLVYDADQVAWLTIAGAWGFELAALGRLAGKWPDPGDARSALFDCEDELRGIVAPSHRARMRASLADLDSAQTLAALERCEASLVSLGDRRLGRLDPAARWPVTFAVHGALPDEDPETRPPMVAIVGMRRCSESGARLAFDLGRELAQAGVGIVSGLAYGIDRAAHDGAASVGGSHVAVLAGGFEQIYPRVHRPLADAIVAGGGALVSHVSPHLPSPGWRFPVRNRLIAGLADIVVVVEAAARGGTLSTARHARDLGRTLLAVPGFPRSPHSTGTNALLADGVEVCRDAGDVSVALGLVCAGSDFVATLHARADSADGAGAPVLSSELSAGARGLFDLIEHTPRALDSLTHVVHDDPVKLFAFLDELEIAGLVTFPSPATVQRL